MQLHNYTVKLIYSSIGFIKRNKLFVEGKKKERLKIALSKNYFPNATCRNAVTVRSLSTPLR